MLFLNRFILSSLVLGTGMAASQATAQTVAYNNTNTFTGNYYINDAGGTAGAVGGNYSTRMVANDVTLASGSVGSYIDSVAFTAVNVNSTNVNAIVNIGIWTDTGVDGSPSNLLYSGSAPISIGGGYIGYFDIPGLDVNVPADGNVWIGEWFTTSGSDTSEAALDHLGMGIFSPIATGSMGVDQFFLSATGFQASDTPGGYYYNFDGDPPSSFGFEVETTPTPEPSSIAMAALGGLGLLGFRRMRKA